MTPRVLVNGRGLLRPVSGVERYTREVLARLPGEVTVLQPPGFARGWLGHLWEQACLPLKLGRNAMLWLPANTGPVASSGHVLTLHDLSALEHPEWFRPGFAVWYRLIVPIIARRAAVIVTDSHSSRSRIVARFAGMEGRLKVVYPGVDVDRFSPVPVPVIDRILDRHAVSRPYFLFVGPTGRRKNVEVLLSAMRRVWAENPRVSLVLVGSGAGPFRSLEDNLRQGWIRPVGRVTDEELAALYTAALALILPSSYEGFALTGLEALACGTRVVASDIPVFREVLGEAAVYFDPSDARQLASALVSLASRGGASEAERKRGRETAEAFPWQRTATQIWQILDGAGQARFQNVDD